MCEPMKQTVRDDYKKKMHFNERLAVFTDMLPWRVRRHLEQLRLSALRFSKGLRELSVDEGSPSGSLIAVGDIALLGSAGEALESSEREGLSQDIRSLLAGCDLRIGNLEVMLTDKEKKTGSIGGFLTAPLKAINILTNAKFDVVSIANNHARDGYLSGMLQCRQLLEQHGIQSCGGGQSLDQSRYPAIIEVKGVKIGVLGYCDNFRVDINASENIAPAPAFDDWVEFDIRSLRSKVDLIVVQLHWGWEFSLYPLLNYRDRARRFAELGADLVLCHHAHVPMGVEVWKKSLIAHGLGNFIFPPDEYLLSGHPWTNRSILLKVFFNKSGLLSAEIVPIVIDKQGYPNIATGHQEAEILGGVGRASCRLLDDELLAWIERDRTVRETFAYFSNLQKSDPALAQEWSLQLQSPFLKDIVFRLGHNFGIAGEQLASFMHQFSASSADPRLAAALSRRCREDDLVAALATLRKSYPFLQDLPGLVP